MALGFIKKVFSFGKKQAEEAPLDKPIENEVEEAVQTHEVIKISASPQPEASIVDEEAPAEKPVADVTPKPQDTPLIEVEVEPTLAKQDEQTVEPDIEQATPELEEQPLEEPEQDIITNVEVEKTIIDTVEQPTEAPIGDVSPSAADPAAEEITQDATETEAPKNPENRVTVAETVSAVEESTPQVEPTEPAEGDTWFKRLRQGLSRTSNQLSGQITDIFTKRKLDEDTLQDLEDVLIQSDLGLETAIHITETLSSTRYGKDVSTEDVTSIMAAEIEKVLEPVAKSLELDLSHKPHVILVVGVNGTGKTTTIGKLASKLTKGGLNVMLAAGDTFRAAAIEQLKIWGERTNSPVVSSKLGADAAGLAFDAFEQAKAAGSDVLIIDTAGRLQNRTELMDELEKIVRVLGKHDPDAPHTVLQTLDATTGQNALNQVEIFRNVAGVNGLVMTKLDGTARGGILVAISAKHKLPVYFIGVGEGVDDLEPFAAKDFAEALAGPRQQ